MGLIQQGFEYKRHIGFMRLSIAASSRVLILTLGGLLAEAMKVLREEN
ncbi:MAG: hypothetical protein V4457_12165 [Pseudomonadota bacterium]